MLNKKALASARIASGTTTDADFEYVTMLLHGDGTNGAQNNAFIDGSTNNFTVTRNGNVTQGSLTPFGDRWSNYFDGSTDYLDVAASANLQLNGDFTIEGWCWLDSTVVASRPDNLKVMALYGGGGASSGTCQIGFDGSASTPGTGLFIYQDNPFIAASVSVSIPLNSWVYIAFVRTGSTIYGFVNGTRYTLSVTSGSASATLISSGQASRISGGVNTSYIGWFKGYISNFRVLKGTALYTANFTPPTAPLTAITNTSLLTCQSNRFRDNSSNNFTITRNGDVSVRPFSPFSPSAAYSSSTNGGSGYFDGAGDYLTCASNTAFEFGTGQYTVEFWIYFNAVENINEFISTSNDSSTGRWCIYYNAGSISVVRTGGGGATTYAWTPTVGRWYHIAASRDASNNQRLFLDGVLVATATSTNSYAQSGFRVGWNPFATGPYLNGYVSNVRIVKGTAVYTANFTPPTAPLTAITNTSLLLNFTNGGIIDNAADNVLETVGNAQISTSVKKFGTGSLAFDGTGDWLLTPDSVDLRLGTGNFTIEFWLYLSATGAARGIVGKGGSTTGWLVSVNSSNAVVFTYGTSTITSTGTLSGSTWYHIAVVRSGTGSNQTKIYIDGTNDGTGTVSTDFTQTEAMYVGANRTGGDALNGYIDDLRITKGVARYTANFTPPTAAFPDL